MQPFNVEGKTCGREDEGMATGTVVSPEYVHGPAGEAMDGASQDVAVTPGEVFDVELTDLRRLVLHLSLSLAPHVSDDRVASSPDRSAFHRCRAGAY